MSDMVFSIGQIRRWSHAADWMVNGSSQTHDVFYVRDSEKHATLPAGGWTLSASDYLRLMWKGDASIGHEGLYQVILNQNLVYTGLWQPKLGETVTESFFWGGDLLVINYRLLKVTPDTRDRSETVTP